MMNNPFDIAKGLKGLEAFLWEEEHNKQLMFETMANLVGSYENDYSEETKNFDKNIKPGNTIEVCEIFQLSNKKSDVELEISNAFLIGGDIAEGTIKIQ